MGISIQGVKVTSIDLRTEVKDIGTEEKIKGAYELVSNTGIVLAKQTFNEYNGVAVSFSSDTLKLLKDFKQSVLTDINRTLGME